MDSFPSVFVSHGAPTYALEPGRAGAELHALGRALGNPRAILMISPHWMTSGVRITAASHLDTVHDFGGFAPALYELEYPAHGDPVLAEHIADVMRAASWPTTLDSTRGLDHGAWVPLRHMYPDAQIPVLQMSMPRSLTPDTAFEFGRALASLKQEGVLIIGSGSLTHNLYEFRQQETAEAQYVKEFSRWIAEAVYRGDNDRLIKALSIAPHAQRAHPTPEHYLPLVIALGAADSIRPSTSLEGGIRHGVLSMDSFVFGRAVKLEAEGETA